MSIHRAKSAVVYLRVSTARQGHSGLGLEAQRTAVETYAASGGQAIVAEFVEVESGKRDDRPQLAAALAACRLHRATLVIAKLDRLARNVRFISGIMDSGVPFVAVGFRVGETPRKRIWPVLECLWPIPIRCSTS